VLKETELAELCDQANKEAEAKAAAGKK
jgi:hypothetical protein